MVRGSVGAKELIRKGEEPEGTGRGFLNPWTQGGECVLSSRSSWSRPTSGFELYIFSFRVWFVSSTSIPKRLTLG